MVFAGFALVLTAMWLASYFSISRQPGSIRAILFGAGATLASIVLGLWLWEVAWILF